MDDSPHDSQRHRSGDDHLIDSVDGMGEVGGEVAQL